MVGKCKKKGIMGGTFDPIHIGHLILGENACLQLGLDSILFMPSGNPPHKPHRPGRATTMQRVEMVRLAIEDNPHFELSLAETHDQGYTYTEETLRRLTAEIRTRIIILLWEPIPCFSSSTGKGRRKSAAWPLWWWLSGTMFPRKNWMLRFFT